MTHEPSIIEYIWESRKTKYTDLTPQAHHAMSQEDYYVDDRVYLTLRQAQLEPDLRRNYPRFPRYPTRFEPWPVYDDDEYEEYESK